ncbi:hypothetical protein BHYA_0034g00100 [Botrytis hyacinthi]|uniref:Uncharacterized protein n=1 Tax=Botrytis hyacinthi TaxID=278943 RepID=A0A4Z1GZD5_9HELO|nr:hypothetical protein BHYA_0034g00100 [Botrytis hyacinthi]
MHQNCIIRYSAWIEILAKPSDSRDASNESLHCGYAADSYGNATVKFIACPIIVGKRLKEWPQALESIEEKQALLRLAFEELSDAELQLPVIESFWAKRAMEAGDPSVAESGVWSIDAEFTISQCVEQLAFTQDDFNHINGSALAVVLNQAATGTVSAEQQAANEAEQARLFGESRE